MPLFDVAPLDAAALAAAVAAGWPGAVLGGPLTCAVLEADRLRFLQT
jgi:hypothetical protein